jgi:Glycosyltransferase family 87
VKRAALLVLLAGALLGPSTAGATAISASQATRIANRDPKAIEERDKNPGLTSSPTMNDGNWEVGYFAGSKEVALVVVDPSTGAIREAWTGYQVAWKMARGYPGAFGHKLDAVYVFIPLCALFLLGLVDWRRPWRAANLDLFVLIGFGASFAFFNQGEIGVSVPLQYPPLVYLLGRALWIGFRGRGEGIRSAWPATWLLIGSLFLIGFRVGLNVADSGVIDVGYAGVVGADRIAHGEPIYDNFPENISQGDTYGPVNYLAYVPFERIWPWSGAWNDLPSAHAAAVAFDLLTFGFLILLGIRIRPGPEGRKLAATLAFGWAAFPYTAYVLESNSNDSLVAMLLVATLLVLARPMARGAMTALATLTKFAPVLLAPMLLTYRGSVSDNARVAGGNASEALVREFRISPMGAARRRWWRGVGGRFGGPVSFTLGFLAVSVLVLLWPAIEPGLHTFYERTIAYQAGRNSPFSIWGQLPSLEPLRIAFLVATAVLAVFLAVRPRNKTLIQVAALGAALLIALQITMHHWFYLYIVWFYPLLLLALAGIDGDLSRSSHRHPEAASAAQGQRPRTAAGSVRV